MQECARDGSLPFYLWFAPIIGSDISTFLRLENLKERTVSSHVSRAYTVKVPQTYVHYFKCWFHHKAHFTLAWKISRNDFLSQLPFMSKTFNYHILRGTPLHIFILRQPSFFFVTLRPFSTIIKMAFK